jgi:hypothetical protein
MLVLLLTLPLRPPPRTTKNYLQGLCSVQRGPVSLAAVSLSVDGQIYNSAPARGPGTIAFNEVGTAVSHALLATLHIA